ncbi:MAG: 6-carboxytetrahydropterin synthase [Flavobacteriales bacterium]|nr:6-carboxytetrahydropterin synthase [Flavobacteriales bacterium]
MNLVRITKTFHFEMAHALHGYDGKCAQIHGHSYKLHVTITGKPNMEEGNPKLGMVIDFGDLKRIVSEQIISKLDHAVLLSKHSGKVSADTTELLQNIVYVDYQPTCENMVIDMAAKLQNELPINVKLHSVKLEETASSYAEWFASDNLI